LGCPHRGFVKTKKAKPGIAQRRGAAEKTKKPKFGRAIARKPNNKGTLGFNPAERETILDFLCAFASLREKQVFGFRGFKKTDQKQTQCIAQRRRGAEKTNKPKFGRAIARKPNNKGTLGFNPAERETIRGFPCAFASLRENIAFMA